MWKIVRKCKICSKLLIFSVRFCFQESWELATAWSSKAGTTREWPRPLGFVASAQPASNWVGWDRCCFPESAVSSNIPSPVWISLAPILKSGRSPVVTSSLSNAKRKENKNEILYLSSVIHERLTCKEYVVLTLQSWIKWTARSFLQLQVQMFKTCSKHSKSFHGDRRCLNSGGQRQKGTFNRLDYSAE